MNGQREERCKGKSRKGREKRLDASQGSALRLSGENAEAATPCGSFKIDHDKDVDRANREDFSSPAETRRGYKLET